MGAHQNTTLAAALSSAFVQCYTPLPLISHKTDRVKSHTNSHFFRWAEWGMGRRCSFFSLPLPFWGIPPKKRRKSHFFAAILNKAMQYKGKWSETPFFSQKRRKTIKLDGLLSCFQMKIEVLPQTAPLFPLPLRTPFYGISPPARHPSPTQPTPQKTARRRKSYFPWNSDALPLPFPPRMEGKETTSREKKMEELTFSSFSSFPPSSLPASMKFTLWSPTWFKKIFSQLFKPHCIVYIWLDEI